jgi:lysozyme family protein
MASFEKAYKRTGGHEGGLADSPIDKGGLTWKGVARNYHPTWPGWVIVDGYIEKLGLTETRKTRHFNKAEIKALNAVLFADKSLEDLVYAFYERGFWDISQLDRFTGQLLAENLYDASVNCGAAMGPRFLQKALNALNSFYGLKVDNVVGNMTFGALSDALVKFGEQKIVDKFVDVREQYHRDIVKRDPSQAGNLPGWLARCERMRKAA